MEATKTDAQKSLEEIDDIAQRTKQAVAYAGTDTALITWGVVWFLGYLGSQFIPMLILRFNPDMASKIGVVISVYWAILLAAGIMGTVRIKFPVESKVGKRIGMIWPILYAYIYLLGYLVAPFIKLQSFDESMHFWAHMVAISAIVPMLAYVIMGLWLDSFLMWIGLAVTVLTMLGLLLFPSYINIWMALVGGGTLISAGLFVRGKWRQK
jgi:hypothetical protein